MLDDMPQPPGPPTQPVLTEQQAAAMTRAELEYAAVYYAAIYQATRAYLGQFMGIAERLDHARRRSFQDVSAN